MLIATAAFGTATVGARAATLVALGDSYSSGQGVPPYELGSTGRLNTCYRSSGAWPTLVARALDMQRRSVACNGASVAEVVRSNPDREPGRKESQIARIGSAADLITLTIGGNDVGFVKVLGACIWRRRACNEHFTEGGVDRIEADIDRLRGKLVDAYRAVRRAAPRARIVVVGYPRIFPREVPRRPAVRNCAAWNEVSVTEASYLNAKTRSLNATIAGAAADVGVEFISVANAFDGHELRCDGEPWVHRLKLFREGRLYSLASFHPNRSGHRRLAEIVLERLSNSR